MKRHKLTLLLFFIFVNWSIAIFFSWLSKIIILTTEIDYLYNQPNVKYPNTVGYWFLLRIVDFRISLTFVAIGIIFSYIFKVGIFEKGYNQVHKIIVFTFGAYTLIFSIFIYERGNTLLDAINFLNVLILLTAIYVPFMVCCYMSYRVVDDPSYKKAFLSLVIMSLSFILLSFNLLIDRLLILYGNPDFSVFYFMAWIWLIVRMTGAYLGFIKPKE